MSQFCSNPECNNPGQYVINGDLLCTSCAKHDIDTDHWCLKHQIATGEGDICHLCEEEFDRYRALLDVEMKLQAYQLWFVLNSRQYRCPVYNFDEAKILYHALRGVTGVRIARMDPFEGCESVLHKFN